MARYRRWLDTVGLHTYTGRYRRELDKVRARYGRVIDTDEG